MYKEQIYFFLLFTTSYFALYHIYKKSKLSAWVFFYMSWSGLTASYHPRWLSPWLNNYNVTSVSEIGMNSFMFLICSYVFIYLLSRKGLRTLTWYFTLFFWLESLYIIACKFLLSPHYGMGLNTSTEGTMLVLGLPLVLFKRDQFRFLHKYPVLYAIPIYAIFLTKSSMGIGGVAVALGAHFLIKSRWSLLNKSMAIVTVAILILSLGYFMVGERFFSTSGRWAAWEWSMGWWFSEAKQMIGTGLGTYWGFGPFVQITNIQQACTASNATVTLCEAAKIKYSFGNYFTFMHNDWLQLLFEAGWIGLGLGIAVLVNALKRASATPWLLVTIIGIAVQSIGNMVCRYTIPALFILLILRLSLDKKFDVLFKE